MPLKALKKILEQEILDDSALNFLGQLVVVVQVRVVSEGDVLVEFPHVVEVVLDLLPQLHFEPLLVVKLLKGPEELHQVVPIVQIFVELFKLLEDVDKVSHDVREDGNTK